MRASSQGAVVGEHESSLAVSAQNAAVLIVPMLNVCLGIANVGIVGRRVWSDDDDSSTLRSWTRDARSSGVAYEKTIAGASDKPSTMRRLPYWGGFVTIGTLDNVLLLLVTNVYHRTANQTCQQIVSRRRGQILGSNWRHGNRLGHAAKTVTARIEEWLPLHVVHLHKGASMLTGIQQMGKAVQGEKKRETLWARSEVD